MLAICGKCREIDRDVLCLRIPAEGHMPAHDAAWCGECIDTKMRRVISELHQAAAEIAALRRQMDAAFMEGEL